MTLQSFGLPTEIVDAPRARHPYGFDIEWEKEALPDLFWKVTFHLGDRSTRVYALDRGCLEQLLSCLGFPREEIYVTHFSGEFAFLISKSLITKIHFALYDGPSDDKGLPLLEVRRLGGK